MTTDSPFDEVEELAAMVTINSKQRTGISIAYNTPLKLPLKEAVSFPAAVRIELTVGVGNASKKVGRCCSDTGNLDAQLQGLGKTSVQVDVNNTKHNFTIEAA